MSKCTLLIAAGAVVACACATSPAISPATTGPRSRPLLLPEVEPPAAPTEQTAIVREGWHGEVMPEGLRRSAIADVYAWELPDGSTVQLMYVEPAAGAARRTPYYLGRTELPVESYAAFCSESGYAAPTHGALQDAHLRQPVRHVTWHDAQAFCTWAGLRLPTRVELDAAIRGTPIAEIRPWIPGSQRSVPVHEEDRSVHGVYDLRGSLMEWCATDEGLPADRRPVFGDDYHGRPLNEEGTLLPTHSAEVIGFRVALSARVDR